MIKISFWGDCKIDNINSVAFDTMTKSILEDCDLNVVNFEAPVKSSGKPLNKSGPNINQSTDTPSWLEKNGFNVISLANNHIMDYGNEGYNKTIDLFQSSLLVGAGDWPEAYKIKTTQVENKKIGFLSLTHCEFGTLTDKYDKKNSTGAAWIGHPDIPVIIANGKKIVDFLFILPHAGIEYIDVPLPEWRDIYKSFIALGADAVITSHPHVPQGWEIYKGKPIFYSLGNFCFHKNVSLKSKPLWNDSLCVIISIEGDSTFQFQVKNIQYTGSSLILREDIDIISHTTTINNYLSDEELYLSKVNQYCKDLIPVYKGYFSAGGYHYLTEFNWRFIKKIVSIISGRIKGNPLNIINNIRCESHRWAFTRALKNESNVM